MNKNLNEAIFGMGKVDAMMVAIEQTYLDVEVMPEDKRRADLGVYAFYALWDAVHGVAESLDALSGDCLVVDVIYAANDVKRKNGTLKTEI